MDEIINELGDAYGAVLLPYAFVDSEDFHNVYAVLPLPGYPHLAPCAGSA